MYLLFFIEKQRAVKTLSRLYTPYKLQSIFADSKRKKTVSLKSTPPAHKDDHNLHYHFLKGERAYFIISKSCYMMHAAVIRSPCSVWWAKLHVHTVECQYMSGVATPVVKQKRYYLSGLGDQ